MNSNSILSSGSICVNEISFNSNIVKSMNEQVNSVRPFIEYSIKDQYKDDEDHVVPRRSIFQMIIQGSKQSFIPKNRFYPVRNY